MRVAALVGLAWAVGMDNAPAKMLKRFLYRQNTKQMPPQFAEIIKNNSGENVFKVKRGFEMNEWATAVFPLNDNKKGAESPEARMSSLIFTKLVSWYLNVTRNRWLGKTGAKGGADDPLTFLDETFKLALKQVPKSQSADALAVLKNRCTPQQNWFQRKDRDGNMHSHSMLAYKIHILGVFTGTVDRYWGICVNDFQASGKSDVTRVTPVAFVTHYVRLYDNVRRNKVHEMERASVAVQKAWTGMSFEDIFKVTKDIPMFPIPERAGNKEKQDRFLPTEFMAFITADRSQLLTLRKENVRPRQVDRWLRKRGGKVRTMLDVMAAASEYHKDIRDFNICGRTVDDLIAADKPGNFKYEIIRRPNDAPKASDHKVFGDRLHRSPFTARLFDLEDGQFFLGLK
ncbi:MAG: uncharacterized protein KVP18_004552 [Porospora cf. gigantea A]|uniref:uncharacterized protein n=1 Tax=Porospora cf. gigantea A TaxID=2853593 RepID=UPI00355A4A36|nr:MAG: hypothetical protein KVP18_004552 [Porospora cf. gigantea A]